MLASDASMALNAALEHVPYPLAQTRKPRSRARFPVTSGRQVSQKPSDISESLSRAAFW